MRKKSKTEIVNKATLFARNPFFDELFKVKDAKIGSTLRIRLPSDYKVKNMVTDLTEKQKLNREQRRACIDFSISVHARKDDTATDEALIKTAKRLYRFIKKGK